MANVVIVSSSDSVEFNPWIHGTTLLLRHSADIDVFGEHKLVEDPKQADIILFGEMGECGFFAERVRAHPFYRRFPEKCFLFDSGDTVFPVMPGIYASLTQSRYRRHHTRTGFYLYVIENPFIRAQPITGREEYLATFMGSSLTHPLRQQILSSRCDKLFLKDTRNQSYKMHYEAGPQDRAPFYLEYADAMANARFSLCPRGIGAGSIRLFESMKMGRACVIISDAWQPNDGARSEWEKWFSEKVRFHRVVELCLDIRAARTFSGTARRFFDMRHIPLHPRLYLRSKKILYRNHKRLYW